MKYRILLVIISYSLLAGCGNKIDNLNKRIPDEFMVLSNPPLKYPKEYILINSEEMKIAPVISNSTPDNTEQAFLEHFK